MDTAFVLRCPRITYKAYCIGVEHDLTEIHDAFFISFKMKWRIKIFSDGLRDGGLGEILEPKTPTAQAESVTRRIISTKTFGYFWLQK